MIASGGVCAILDYDIDQMTDYVAEMTQRLLPSATTATSSMRKFVSGLLSSTRLPSTTILLGMHYLAKHINMCSSASTCNMRESEVWRMLTVGLLLGSKFLDDNTFQNRSWSEVSGISVSDLNKLERSWLLAMNYCIYINLDTNIDFNAWLANWNHWCKVRNNQRKANLDRLTPLTLHENSHRGHAFGKTFNKIYSKPTPPMEPPPGFKHSFSKNIWGQPYATPPYLTPPYLTPPLAPDSGLNTPVYMNMNVNVVNAAPRYSDWNKTDSFSNRSYSQLYPSQMQTAFPHNPIQVAAYHTPIFQGPDFQYGQSMWNHSPTCDLYSCYSCKETRNPNSISISFPPMVLGNQILAG